MYARQITSEETYTLREARCIINAERKTKRESLLYKAKQKIVGLLAIGISIASPILLDGDATISVIMLPLGIYMIFTKEKVIYWKAIMFQTATWVMRFVFICCCERLWRSYSCKVIFFQKVYEWYNQNNVHWF